MNHHFKKLRTTFFVFLNQKAIALAFFFCIFFSFTVTFPITEEAPTTEKHDKEVAAKYYRRANHAYNKGKVAKAIRLIKKAIELDKANENYINGLATMYHKEEKFNQALTYLKKSREVIQDSLPKQAVQMMNWEGCYALSNGLRKQAILSFEAAAHHLDKYAIVDSLLKSSIYCNWGVAEIYDQGKSKPCNSNLLGECYQIHITDVNRAFERFQTSWNYHPDECNKETRWNLAFTQEMLKIPADTLSKYKGYFPKGFIEDIVISPQDTFCPLPFPKEEDIAGSTGIDLGVFENVLKYKEVLFVLDISGSMRQPISKESLRTRFNLMKDLVGQEIKNADSTQKIGILTIGGNCPITPLVDIEVDTGNRKQLTNTLNRLQPEGYTPLYSTLAASPKYFSAEENEKIILLASDGMESCQKYLSVCQLAEDLCNQGIKIEVFSLLLDEKANYDAYGLYQCMSDACQTKFTGVEEDGKVEEKTVKKPIGNYSMIIDREDVLTGIYKPSAAYF